MRLSHAIGLKYFLINIKAFPRFLGKIRECLIKSISLCLS